MKKKLFFTLLSVLFVALVALAYGTVTVTKVQDDDCIGCTFTTTANTCGKCQGAMSSTLLEAGDATKKGHKYQFTCGTCQHSCIYWVKR